jgi:nitrogen fixation protein FixH
MDQQTNKKSKIPYLFFIFFAVFITVDGIYIYLAQKTWRGLATEDGYKKGLKYNETLDLVKKQNELGWSGEIKFDQASKNLHFRLFDKNKNPIRTASVIAKITRPVQEGYDFEIPLNYDSKSNSYFAHINFPLKGQWNIEIISSLDSNFYQNVKRVVIK